MTLLEVFLSDGTTKSISWHVMVSRPLITVLGLLAAVSRCTFDNMVAVSLSPTVSGLWSEPFFRRFGILVVAHLPMYVYKLLVYLDVSPLASSGQPDTSLRTCYTSCIWG